MRLRHEPFGAWLLDDARGLVALSHEGVRALGLPAPARVTEPRPPLEVHMAVTARCAAGCHGCYTGATANGVEPPRAELEARLDALARAGVFVVAFGGGEPTTRRDLAELARAARARGLVPVVTTSGLGLDDTALDALALFARVNVSYDGAGEAYRAVRGFDGAGHAERAIERLAARGVEVGVNVVLTRATFGSLAETARVATRLGARELQLLRYKPQGRAKSLAYLDVRLGADQGRALPRVVRELVTSQPTLRVRVDCALVPFLVHAGDFAPAELTAFGILGCEAGEYLLATNVAGFVAPCSFADPTPLAAEHLAHEHLSEPTLQTWRTRKVAAEPCASCTYRAVCRGGCHVVSTHLAGDTFAPDPECPRVLAHVAQLAQLAEPS